MENNKKNISWETLSFLRGFEAAFPAKKSAGKKERAVNPAFLYEKFRNAIEYQEDHLILKNAVSRIIRRKYTLTPNISAEGLQNDLVAELSWANYIKEDTLGRDELDLIKAVLSRYLILLKSARSSYVPKHELNKVLISWLACEIDHILKPGLDSSILVDYAYSILKQNLNIQGSRISAEDHEMQLKLAIFTLIFKPDYPLLQYWVLQKIYPDWIGFSDERLAEFGTSFDPYYNRIERTLNYPERSRYFVFTKRNIAPFLLMKGLSTEVLAVEKIEDNPRILKNTLIEIYDSLIVATREKVWRGTIRALVFIFLTKISLAFFLEVPFDRYFSGSIHYVSLAINILLPPLLMFAAGIFVKSPSSKNKQIIEATIDNIIYENKIGDKKYSLEKTATTSFDGVFNAIYWLVSGAILFGMIWLLLYLNFNVLSVILFFIFVSAVSFFSFRIRNIALELAMTPAKNGGITSTVEFAFSPFIRIGKYISDRFSRANPFILALDFLIEAPFKSILKITNSWLKFVNAKKEEIDL